MWNRLWVDARVATMAAGAPAPYGAIDDAALASSGGRIAWVGARADLPGAPEELSREVIGCDGAWITPALVDCHTHLVFAGDRAREFELRLQGASYEDIARAGGGILSTVRATRAASVEALADGATPRLDRLIADGAATVEIKSGYGLDLETELAMLRAAGALAERRRVRVRRTFLGAHAVPPEYAGRADEYIDLVCSDMIPAVARERAADAVDAFCEGIGFTPAQVERVFEAARAHGLAVKLHAEQLSNLNGAALAARFGALSADHLEHVDDAGLAAMAEVGTVAVLLPAAFYFLRDTKVPPIGSMRAAGVAMAVATDCNPGTSPCPSLLMAMNMACTLFRMTPEEALAGATREGARALGLQGEIGTLEIGKACDLALWSIDHPAELSYWIGLSPLRYRVVSGEPDEGVP